MRSILHKATCQWPLPSSHLLCESPGVIRAPSCIFHHAGSCCWNSSVNGNSRRHDLNKLGLEFLHTAFIYFPSKGSYWKNKYPVHNLLKGSYCTQRQIIILLPYGWGQRGISFLTAIQCCLLAVVFLAVCSLCTARMGKTGFFQQSKIRFLWKSFHTSRQGRQQSWKKEGVGSRKKDPSNLSSWRKRPSSLSGQDKACKENKGKNKRRAGQTPHTKNHSSLVRVPFASYKPHQSRRLSLQADGSAFHSPAEMVLQENLRRHSTTSWKTQVPQILWSCIRLCPQSQKNCI